MILHKFCCAYKYIVYVCVISIGILKIDKLNKVKIHRNVNELILHILNVDIC